MVPLERGEDFICLRERVDGDSGEGEDNRRRVSVVIFGVRQRFECELNTARSGLLQIRNRHSPPTLLPVAFWRAVVADAELAKHSSFVLRALANVLHWRTVALPIMCVGKEKSCRGKVDDVLHFVRCERGTRVHVRHAIVDELSALLTREKWQIRVDNGCGGGGRGGRAVWACSEMANDAGGWWCCWLGSVPISGRFGFRWWRGQGRSRRRRRWWQRGGEQAEQSDAKRSGGDEQKRRDGSDAGTVLMMLGGFDPGG